MSAHPNPAADPAVRRTGIGGSDAAVICGLSPYKSALDLYLEKIGVYEDARESEAMEWGSILEPVLLQQYAFRRRVNVWGRTTSVSQPYVRYWPSGVVTHHDDHEVPSWVPLLLSTLRHPARPWMMAHVDGVAADPHGRPLRKLECKTSSAFRSREWGEGGTDLVPEEYIPQVNHYDAVFAAHGFALPTDMPVLIGGQSFRVYSPVADPELIEDLIGAEAEFWSCVETRVPPPAEPTERGRAALARLYPTASGEELVAEAADYWLAERLALARIAAERAEERKVAVEVEVKARMGTAAALVGDGWSLTWKNNRPSRVTDFKTLSAHLLERLALPSEDAARVVGEFTTERPGPRVFRCNLKSLEAEHG